MQKRAIVCKMVKFIVLSFYVVAFSGYSLLTLPFDGRHGTCALSTHKCGVASALHGTPSIPRGFIDGSCLVFKREGLSL